MFEFLILSHDMNGLDDFGNVIDRSIDMQIRSVNGRYPFGTIVNNIILYTFIQKKNIPLFPHNPKNSLWNGFYKF